MRRVLNQQTLRQNVSYSGVGLHSGNRVQMTFRRLLTARGIHNYFWKAKPIRE